MIASHELSRLLALVTYRAHVHAVDGLERFRDLLRTDYRCKVLRFLTQPFRALEGERRGGIVFVLAEHYREAEQLGKLEALFANDDPIVRASVLNALWEGWDATYSIKGTTSARLPVGHCGKCRDIGMTLPAQSQHSCLA